jgi:hypothetical protein
MDTENTVARVVQTGNGGEDAEKTRATEPAVSPSLQRETKRGRYGLTMQLFYYE